MTTIFPSFCPGADKGSRSSSRRRQPWETATCQTPPPPSAAVSFWALWVPPPFCRAHRCSPPAAPVIEVYKSPACGCCRLWVEHLEAEGFATDVRDMDDLAQVKMIAGVPDHLAACHTALVDGLVIEGHVPASAIRRLLEERPRRPRSRGSGHARRLARHAGSESRALRRHRLRPGATNRVYMSFVETEPV